MKDKKDSFLTGKERRLRKKGEDKQIEKELEEEAGVVEEPMVESAEHTSSRRNRSTDNKAEGELCAHHPQRYDLSALEAPMPYPGDLQPDGAEQHYPYSVDSNTETQASCTHGNAADLKCDLMLIAGMMIVLATLIGGFHTNGCDHNIGLGNFLS